jgi:hypothetical protein
MQPGIYPNLSDDEYHSSSGVSNSGLVVIADKTPAHYQARLLEPRVETPALTFGKRLHRCVLEPARFASEFAVMPRFDMRTNIGKASRAEWEAENAGRTGIEQDDMDVFHRIRDSAHRHPSVRFLLSSGISEQSKYAIDPVTGALVKCRIDHENNESGKILADLKSTGDASEDAFKGSAFKYRYHQQAAFYLDVDEWCTGKRADAFVFIAVEKVPPYAVKVFEASPSFISRGREAYRGALDLYAECLAANNWPAYDETVAQLDIPVWAENMLQARDNDEIEGMSYVQ